MNLRRITFSLIVWVLAISAEAQTEVVKIDTNYYEKFPDKLIFTPFLVKNITAFSLATPDIQDKVRYYSNSPTGIGLRVGYDWLSFSASYGVGVIDPDFDKNKGKTKALNLQTTFAARKLLVDVYYQNYKGMYLRADVLPPYTHELFYVRPDVNTKMLGVTGMYVFNGKKFTARPPFKFDSWQKKSAGSLFAGIEFLHGSATGDSALVPSAYHEKYPHAQINHMSYLLFGPGVGYGHTFVIKKHFFITNIASVNADAGYVKEYKAAFTETIDKRWRFDPNISLRGGIGYNKPNWELAFSYFTKRLYLTGKSNDNRYLAHNNDYRLSYTQRINPGKTIPKVVNWAGNIIEKLGFGFLIR